MQCKEYFYILCRYNTPNDFVGAFQNFTLKTPALSGPKIQGEGAANAHPNTKSYLKLHKNRVPKSIKIWNNKLP